MADLSISNGEYRINSGSWTTSPGVIGNGDTLQIRRTSSASFSTEVLANITVGDYSTTFSITTKNDPLGEDYLLGLATGADGPESYVLYANLITSLGVPITVSENIAFDWSCLSTPVGGGTSTTLSGSDVLVAGSSFKNVYSYDIEEETMSSLSCSNAVPSTVDGHNIIAS